MKSEIRMDFTKFVLSQDEKYIVGANNKMIVIFERMTGKIIDEIKKEEFDLNSLQISVDSKRVIYYDGCSINYHNLPDLSL